MCSTKKGEKGEKGKRGKRMFLGGEKGKGEKNVSRRKEISPIQNLDQKRMCASISVKLLISIPLCICIEKA